MDLVHFGGVAGAWVLTVHWKRCWCRGRPDLFQGCRFATSAAEEAALLREQVPAADVHRWGPHGLEALMQFGLYRR